MQVEIKSAGKTSAALISGDLDHHTAKTIRSVIDKHISQEKPGLLIIDMAGVTFMDSSGIGLIMGRYRLMEEHGGRVMVSGSPPYIKKVLRLAGVDRLAKLCESYEPYLEKEESEVSEDEPEKADTCQ